MSTISGQIAVTSTAASVPASTTPVIGLGGLVSLKLSNSGANPIQLGPAGVTASTGYTLAASAALTLDLEGDDTLYAVSALGSTLQVLALGKEIGG